MTPLLPADFTQPSLQTNLRINLDGTTGICILLAIVLLIPIPMRLKDGGTVVYNAILYQVENVHRIDPEATSENDYLEGMIVKILGIEVYNNVE